MIEIRLNNNSTVNCSLGLMALKNLRHKNKNLYAEANKVIFEGTKSIEDLTNAIYAGYVACCKEKPKYSFDEFTKLLPDSIKELSEIAKKML